MAKSKYDDLQENIRKMETPEIEIWENKYLEKEFDVKYETGEFTCVCPKTGLPDFAFLSIEYSPKKYCIELKSFKEYLLFFRDVGVFHEHVVNKILDDLVSVCSPRKMKVKGLFNARGGIVTTVESEYIEN